MSTSNHSDNADSQAPFLPGTAAPNPTINNNGITSTTNPSSPKSHPPTTATKPRTRPKIPFPMRDMPIKPLHHGMDHTDPSIPSNFCTNGPMDCYCGLPPFWDNNICCDGCDMWIHFGCARLSSDQVKRIREYICGRCGDFSDLRTVWKTGEEVAEEGEEALVEEERRAERKRKANERRKVAVQGRKRMKSGGRGLVDSAVEEDVDGEPAMAADDGDGAEMDVAFQGDEIELISDGGR